MVEREFKRPPLRYRWRHILRQMFNGWPWIVWLAAAAGVLILLPGGWHRVRFYGEAERNYEYVAPLVDGRLKTLLVQIGDNVRPGQLIGEIDSASLEAELLMDRASLMKTRDRIQDIRCEIQEKKLEQARTEARLKELEARWAHTQELLRKKLVLEQQVEDLRPQIAATKEILAQYPAVIDHLIRRLELAEKSAKLFDPDRLEKLRKEQCRLTASMEGVVSEVFHRPGDTVKAGDPVVRISNTKTDRVIAFLPAGTKADIQPGKTCQIITINRETHPAVVRSVTADIRRLPMFTGFGERVQRGRRVVIQLTDGASLVPGERVVVVPDLSIFDQWFGRKK